MKYKYKYIIISAECDIINKSDFCNCNQLSDKLKTDFVAS